MRFPDQAERAKRARLITLLDDGMVTVHVDARLDGVDVPPHLRGDLMLALNLSRRFQLDVFELGPLAIRASLSFNGEPYPCVLPWRALWRLESRVTGEVALFEDSVPPELLAAAEASPTAEAEQAKAEPEAPPPPPRGRPHLRIVK
ncbi:MAG: stringent starvation protein B [Myxococcales bacterium]|nr:stringent starvation protein B [Myxococcales bacterium]MCB9522258.1 stringent starvation protein B [Myxococcales bacterium]